jgi:murein L,D-transpeptidase YcbB/YkuD
MALETLKSAPDHGFSAKRFHAQEIERLLGSAAGRAEGERQLRCALLDYARAQHGLTIPANALPRAWNQRPSSYDAPAELDAALRSGRLRAWLDELPPQTPLYRTLQAAYVAAQQRGPEKPRPSEEVPSAAVGEHDPSTEAPRERPARERPEPADAAADAPADPSLVSAPQTNPADHELGPSGVPDDSRAARPSAPALSEAATLRVNMERLRWLARPEPARRIDVNIAAAVMDYFRDGELATHMLAVAGRRGDETPIVSSAIDSIVLNPPWHVPPRIARKEILPKGSAYLRARHFAWRDGRLIQRPGPKAALGRVKFDFPNPYGVYLHDTPTRSTFSQTTRTASHGCVRLERAVELARTLVAEEGSSSARIDSILNSGRTARLMLTPAIPVRLIYLTAVANGDTISYLPDVYGWDAKLLALLDRYSTPTRARRRS